jgi:aldehyde dehydrogenase (NAD+)
MPTIPGALRYPAFISECKKRLAIAFGADPEQSDSYCRLVTSMHAGRIEGMIKQAVKKGAERVGSAIIDAKSRYVPPTLLLGITKDDFDAYDVMTEEIFGPILPVLKVGREDFGRGDISRIVKNVHPKPLALYVFGKDRPFIDDITNNTPSGGVCINDVVFHYANSFLPFGGIGPSGMGSAHGVFGFQAFSHQKGILRKDDHMVLDIPQRYPPYSSTNLAIFRLNCYLPSLPYIGKDAARVLLFSALVVAGICTANYFGIVRF